MLSNLNFEVLRARAGAKKVTSRIKLSKLRYHIDTTPQRVKRENQAAADRTELFGYRRLVIIHVAFPIAAKVRQCRLR
jgi:hypothetical protein